MILQKRHYRRWFKYEDYVNDNYDFKVNALAKTKALKIRKLKLISCIFLRFVARKLKQQLKSKC